MIVDTSGSTIFTTIPWTDTLTNTFMIFPNNLARPVVVYVQTPESITTAETHTSTSVTVIGKTPRATATTTSNTSAFSAAISAAEKLKLITVLKSETSNFSYSNPSISAPIFAKLLDSVVNPTTSGNSVSPNDDLIYSSTNEKAVSDICTDTNDSTTSWLDASVSTDARGQSNINNTASGLFGSFTGSVAVSTTAVPWSVLLTSAGTAP